MKKVVKNGNVVARPKTAESAHRFTRTKKFAGSAVVDDPKSKSRSNWPVLWQGIAELVQEFGDRIIFIGGIAVYLYVSDVEPPKGFVELSHDGDFLISLVDYSTLRDREDVVSNDRLGKHQIIKHGVDFDVYLEHNNKLLVPYDEAMAASIVLPAPGIEGGVRVMSLEHLLVLKLFASEGRRGSAKGDKDERDVIRIVYVLHRVGEVRRELIEPYMTEDMEDSLISMKRSGQFLRMSGGNAHQARILRDLFSAVVDVVVPGREKKGRR